MGRKRQHQHVGHASSWWAWVALGFGASLGGPVAGCLATAWLGRRGIEGALTPEFVQLLLAGALGIVGTAVVVVPLAGLAGLWLWTRQQQAAELGADLAVAAVRKVARATATTPAAPVVEVERSLPVLSPSPWPSYGSIPIQDEGEHLEHLWVERE